MKKTSALAVAALAAVALGGCRTSAQTGSLVGAGLGAGAGAIIGHQSGHRGAGALIGTGVGALAGYAIGNEVDKADDGNRRHGDPYYEPPPYDDGSGRERVIWRERTVYETSDCPPCR
jgi:uncharacterized protein YcfJ